MTDDELLAEAEALNEAFAAAEAAMPEGPEDEEREEPFDPIAFGWLDGRGRP